VRIVHVTDPLPPRLLMYVSVGVQFSHKSRFIFTQSWKFEDHLFLTCHIVISSQQTDSTKQRDGYFERCSLAPGNSDGILHITVRTWSHMGGLTGSAMWDSRVQLSPRTSQGDPDALEPTEKVFRLGSLKFSLIRSAAYMDSGPAS
jgi:hypothetical protein